MHLSVGPWPKNKKGTIEMNEQEAACGQGGLSG